MGIVSGFIGTYADHEGIYKFQFDLSSGRMSDPEIFLRAKDAKCLIYDRGSLISTVSKEDKSGLMLINCRGKAAYENDCKLFEKTTACDIYRDKNIIYTANYHEGTFMIYETAAGELTLKKRIKVSDRAHCHQVFIYEHYLFVVCLGIDKIKIYDIDEDYQFKKDIDFPAGSGPRQAVIDKDASYMYVLTENSNEVFVYEIKSHLSFFCAQIMKVLPTGSKGENYSAAICLSKNGRYLYTTTRGCNIISAFTIIKGCLKQLQFVESGGDHPREMTMDPEGNFLLVSNRYSNRIVVYRIGRTGEIIEQCDEKYVPQPLSIAFLK